MLALVSVQCVKGSSQGQGELTLGLGIESDSKVFLAAKSHSREEIIIIANI